MLARDNGSEWLQPGRLLAGDGFTEATVDRAFRALMHHAPAHAASKLQRSRSQGALARLFLFVLPGQPDDKATLKPGK
ncbi:hypothetical protein D3C86_1977180 [compost metagenome]